ncbi:MAG: prepilin peptidase [Alphaproteobacteria bacterium GM202ARS2]|nr:prepilin peptidase [Alphaproteobacteria bacterium GM202ARS2]
MMDSTVLNAQGAWLLASLCWLTLLWGAVSDIRRRIVPDTCSVLFLAFWVIDMMVAPVLTWQTVLFALAVGSAVFLGGFALFVLGGMGGGDVKWLTAISLWAAGAYNGGGIATLQVLVATFIIGGILALTIMPYLYYCHKRDRIPLRRVMRSFEFPFAPAIAIGGAWVVWHIYGASL